MDIIVYYLLPNSMVLKLFKQIKFSLKIYLS